MSTLKIFYIDTSKSALTSLVSSQTATTPQALNNEAILKDVIDIGIVFVADGAIDTNTDNYSNLTASVGSVSEGQLVSNTNWYVSSSYGFTGSLDYGDVRLTASLGSLINKNYTFSVKANNHTFVYSNITVYNDI